MAAVANAEAMATYRVTDFAFIGGRIRCGFVERLDGSTRHGGARNTRPSPWMVVREGVLLALVGFAIGIVGAGIAGRSISAFLYGVTAWDPITIAGVLGVLLLVAGTACFAPGLRASREDPARALRAD